tara:strand:+ start:1645 stop:2775 length:1131 start_codon:yes stop_codon:yes gene_type:complete
VRAVIVDWARTPFHRAHKGSLSNVRPDEMLGQVTKFLLSRNNVDPGTIDDILVGCAYPEGEQGYNIGRLSVFLGGLPNSVPGATFNRLCGSSMQAILTAAAHIEVGWGDCYLCSGVESMSRIQRRGFNWSPHPELEENYPDAYVNMGITAENVAQKWNISREEQENFALNSHIKASTANQSGFFDDELCAIESDDVVSTDGCIRPNTSSESMSKLKPAFREGGTVTAATSSPLTDGAVSLLVCSEDFASANGLTPLARVVSGAVVGCPPELMGIGPIEATRKALSRADWDVESVDIFEINEAFSSQSIAVIKELGLDESKVNIDGGAIAIGHPLGASGARITGKAASLIQRTNSQRAVATMCIGGGMGIAIALESP